MIFNIESFLYGLTKKRKGQSVRANIFLLIFNKYKHLEQIQLSVLSVFHAASLLQKRVIYCKSKLYVKQKYSPTILFSFLTTSVEEILLDWLFTEILEWSGGEAG
jgi:hypothetical protein